MSELYIRQMKTAEVQQVAAFIRGVFDEFIAPDYCQQGNDEFCRLIEPDAILQRVGAGSFFLVAIKNGQIAGMVEMSNADSIALLFTAREFQARGIAKALLGTALTARRAKNGNQYEVKVNSSPVAVKAYEKMGFVPAGAEQQSNGMRFTPMVLRYS